MDPDLKDLIKKLTHKDYNKRISVKQIKKHPFFQGVDFSAIATKTLACPSVEIETIVD